MNADEFIMMAMLVGLLAYAIVQLVAEVRYRLDCRAIARMTAEQRRMLIDNEPRGFEVISKES